MNEPSLWQVYEVSAEEPLNFTDSGVTETFRFDLAQRYNGTIRGLTRIYVGELNYPSIL